MRRTEMDAWLAGEPYERYVGRWSRRMAPVFLHWLQTGEKQDWGDVGHLAFGVVHAVPSGECPFQAGSVAMRGGAGLLLIKSFRRG